MNQQEITVWDRYKPSTHTKFKGHKHVIDIQTHERETIHIAESPDEDGVFFIELPPNSNVNYAVLERRDGRRISLKIDTRFTPPGDTGVEEESS